MKHEHYPFFSDEESCFFEFESIGPKGIIQKVVSFDYVSDKLWNLAFGDKTNDGWADDVVSNNNDLFKVMSTVIAATIVFSDRYPKRAIQITPLDDRRELLYNAIFERHFDEISKTFDVYGLFEGMIVPYDPTQSFNEFYISRNQPTFDIK